MADALRLMDEGWATSLHSSSPAQLHALSTHLSMDATPYLNQARATYPGEITELDAALHLLHQSDEDLEVGEVTIFVEGAGEAPPPPAPPDHPGVGPNEANTSLRRCVRRILPGADLVPRLPAGHPRASQLGPRTPVPPPSPGPGRQPQGKCPRARASKHPPPPPRRRDLRGLGAGPGGHPKQPLRGRTLAPPPLSRRPRRGTGYPPASGPRRSPPSGGSTW